MSKLTLAQKAQLRKKRYNPFSSNQPKNIKEKSVINTQEKQKKQEVLMTQDMLRFAKSELRRINKELNQAYTKYNYDLVHILRQRRKSYQQVLQFDVKNKNIINIKDKDKLKTITYKEGQSWKLTNCHYILV